MCADLQIGEITKWKKKILLIGTGKRKHPCYIFIKCPSSSLVSPSCWWQVRRFVIPLYTSNPMPSLFMIQFVVPSDRSFVLISCCFASGSFSSMIFIFSCATSFTRRQKGGGCCWSTNGHLHVVVFFGGGGREGHWHVIYKIKSNRDVRLGIINNTICVIGQHKGWLVGMRGGVLYQTNRVAEATERCFYFFSSSGWLRLQWSLQSE